MSNLKNLTPLIISLMLVGCGDSSTFPGYEVTVSEVALDDEVFVSPPDLLPLLPLLDLPILTTPPPEEPIETTTPALTLWYTPTKAFRFSWVAVTGATSYKIKEAITNESGYSVIQETTDTSFDHIVPLYARLNAKYILESCNAQQQCTVSEEVFTNTEIPQIQFSIGYFKASNSDAFDGFGSSVSLSADGHTLAVSAPGESSNSQEINTGKHNDSALSAGAVYVFTRSGAVWSEQAYLKASNASAAGFFGSSVSLSDNGNTLAVGASGESGTASYAGAVYVFTRTGVKWSEQDYLKATNAGENDRLGYSVSLSADGHTLAAGAWGEGSDDTGVGANGDNNNLLQSGAVYVFARSEAQWSQQAYLKASNPGEDDLFGRSLSLSLDGRTLAVGARNEDSNSMGINEDQGNDLTSKSGAVYVFAYADAAWSQQAYLKASNTGINDSFGSSVSVSADGTTLVVGAPGEKSNATGVNSPDQGDGSEATSGAAYVFTRNEAQWSQQAYLKASNTNKYYHFGNSVGISGDGNTLVVGDYHEAGHLSGINGYQGSVFRPKSGAVYTFTRSVSTWSQQAYLKARYGFDNDDEFGYSLALSADAGTLVVGARFENSTAKGINPYQADRYAYHSGAVYLY